MLQAPLKTRSGGVQGIRLVEHAFQLQRAQQLFESSAFAGFACVVGLLGQGNSERAGIDRDLRVKTLTAIFLLNCRSSQRLANRFGDAPGLQRPAGLTLCAPPGSWLIIQAWST